MQKVAAVRSQRMAYLDTAGEQLVHNQQQKSPPCQAVAQAVNQGTGNVNDGTLILNIHHVQGCCSSNKQDLQARYSVNTASCNWNKNGKYTFQQVLEVRRNSCFTIMACSGHHRRDVGYSHFRSDSPNVQVAQ